MNKNLFALILFPAQKRKRQKIYRSVKHILNRRGIDSIWQGHTWMIYDIENKQIIGVEQIEPSNSIICGSVSKFLELIKSPPKNPLKEDGAILTSTEISKFRDTNSTK